MTKPALTLVLLLGLAAFLPASSVQAEATAQLNASSCAGPTDQATDALAPQRLLPQQQGCGVPTHSSPTKSNAYQETRQGCCSWHGGVCGCNAGRAVCCDGSYSPSCGC